MTKDLSPARVLVPMGLAVCLSPCGDLALYAVLITNLQAVGLTLSAVGIMLGVNRLIRIPGNPVAGRLLDRRRRRWVFLAGMFLGVLSTAAYAELRGFWPFLAARLTWGIAWTLINVSSMTMVVDVTDSANRGRWMGAYNTWVLVGLAIGPILGAYLVEALGFRNGMLACSGVTALGLVIALVALPETYRSAEGRISAEVLAGSSQDSELKSAHLTNGLTMVRSNLPLLTALLLYLLTQFAGDGIILSTVSLLLGQRFGERLTVAGVTLGGAAASGLILSMRSVLAGMVGPAAGHLSDHRVNRWSVIAVGLAASVAGFGLLAYDTALWAIVLGVAVGAVGSGAALAALAALVGDLTPPGKEGSVMGAYAAAGDVGSTAGPFLAFALVSQVDASPGSMQNESLRWIYLCCSLAFLVALGLTWLGRRGAKAAQ